METHELVRPSKPYDLYYYDSETSKHQAFPTTFNTRYSQDFQNRSGGTSSFILPPANGYTDVVCSFAFKNPNNASPGAISLPRGFGYALINRVSFRYGGSSTYFMTGDQILQNALRNQTSRSSANDILNLGGLAGSGTDLSNNMTGNVVLTLPHNIPSGVGKKNPFPSDLLTQQILVQVELNPPGSVFTNQLGTVLPAWTQQLDSARFYVSQIMLNNQGDSLSRRHDMSLSAYAYPAEFCQQVVRLPLVSSSASQSVTLTGFRSGQVKSLELWLTRTSDLTTTSASGSTAGYNPFRWYLPSAIQVTYAGEVFSRFDSNSSPLWNLINGDKAPVVDNVKTVGAASAITQTADLSSWVSCPFAQPLVDEDAHYICVNGRNITNGIINLDITTPTAQSDWVLNVTYVYNTTILMSQGTSDFVF